MRLRKDEKGFSLVELMIVVLVIGILVAIALPAFMRARESARAKACQANLQQIDSAKEQYAMENNRRTGQSVSWANILSYIQGGQRPVCPSGGTYTLNVIGTNPVCSIGTNGPGSWDDHVLP